MQEHIAEKSPPSPLNEQHRRKFWLRLLGVALLVSLALGSYGALSHLVPKRVPGPAQGVTTRLSWYLHSGQPRSDVYSLAAAFRFIVGMESDTRAVENHSNPSVAGHAAPSSPKS